VVSDYLQHEIPGLRAELESIGFVVAAENDKQTEVIEKILVWQTGKIMEGLANLSKQSFGRVVAGTINIFQLQRRLRCAAIAGGWSTLFAPRFVQRPSTPFPSTVCLVSQFEQSRELWPSRGWNAQHLSIAKKTRRMLRKKDGVIKVITDHDMMLFISPCDTVILVVSVN